MGVHQPSLVAGNIRITLAKLDFAGASGFHFRSGQDQAGLKPVHEEIVVAGLAVVTQYFEIRVFIRQWLLSIFPPQQEVALRQYF